MKNIFCIMAVVVMGNSCFSQNITSIDSVVKEVFREFTSSRQQAGLALSFYVNGQRYYYQHGPADRITNVPVTSTTIFEIGSVTKTFTGYLLAKATVDKKLDMSDDIRKYLDINYPNLEYKGKPVKLFQLLNHSSGLPFDYIDRSRFDKTNPDSLAWLISPLEKNYSKEQLLNDLHTTRLDTIPGIKLNYSNAAAQLLSYILEDVYDKSYMKLLRACIFQPLKMKSTGFYENLNNKKMAKGYNHKGMMMPYNQSKAAGGLLSNSEDLLKYAILQLDESKNEIFLSHQPTWGNIKYYAMGLNWQMQKKDDYRRIWQSGSTAGFTSLVSLYPEYKISLVLLTNVQDENSEGDLSKIEGRLFESLNTLVPFH